MTRWIGMRLHGELVRDTDTDVAPVQEEVTFLAVPGDLPVSISSQYWDGSGFADKGEKPSGNHTFNYVTKEWELDKERLRNGALLQRASLLLASDWTQLPDVSNEVRFSWREYRQLLRDITEQAEYPIDIQWPIPPGK